MGKNMKNNSHLTSTEKAIADFCINVILYLRKTEKETKVLTTNIYSAADTYLSLTYIIILRVMNASLSVDKKKKIISSINPTIQAGIISEFNFSEKQFTNIIEKRDVYLDEYMKKVFEKSNGEIVLSDIVDEISEILKYDISYNQYVEFNETTEILLTEFEESLQIKIAVTHLYKFTIELLDSLLKEIAKKTIKIKKTKKSNFKTATIVLSIMTILFAASTIGLSIGLIDISNDNQELSSQITDLENTVSSKDKEIAMYKEQISNLKSRLNNFVMSRNAENNGNRLTSEEIKSQIVYCTNNSSPYYHTSTCPDCDRNGFTIWFDTDAVESAGYLPCPNCIEQ